MKTTQKKSRAVSHNSRGSSSAATTALLVSSPPNSSKGKDARQIPTKWVKYYRRLVALRNRVLNEKGDLASGAAEEIPSYSMEMADAATDEGDRDMLLSELSAEQDALYEIDEALKRIENRTYGICELTGKPIREERLMAIPWTRFSVEAEARLERRGALKRAHLGKLGSVHAEVTGDLEESKPAEEQEEKPSGDEALERIFLPPGTRS